MKRLFALVLAGVFLFLSACSFSENGGEQQARGKCVNYADNLKGVWLPYYAIGAAFSSLDEAAAKEKMEEMCLTMKEKGLNTLFFHVRAFADAFYPSGLFPLSENCPQGYDLLQIALETAHRHGISLHAWVNPYRVALDKTPVQLPSDSPALTLYKKSPKNLILSGGGIYLNPASTAAQKLILDGIRELMRNYALDGIHFDDYFYPTAEGYADKAFYASYKNSGGTLSLEEFRCEQVNALIAGVRTVVQSENPNALFGVSPQADIEKNQTQLFADVTAWVEEGYVDYIMPQIYFGFENEASPFAATLGTWEELTQGTAVTLYCGLALYKSGKTDEYASSDTQSEDSPYFEWVYRDDIIRRQILQLKRDGVKGYALFSFDDLENFSAVADADG